MTAFGFAENYISDDSFLKEPYDIQNSIVNHSTIDNTIVHNSNLSYSSVKDTNITGLELNYADVIDDVLVDGMIYNGDYTYFGPFLLSQIYDGISPFSIGYVELSKSKAKADDSVIMFL
jgi:hypothetical protein